MNMIAQSMAEKRGTLLLLSSFGHPVPSDQPPGGFVGSLPSGFTVALPFSQWRLLPLTNVSLLDRHMI